MEQLFIYILSFFIYSFCGWIWESIMIHAIYMKKFVNRGFLNGPMLPIYGSGALIVVLFFRMEGVHYPIYSIFLLGGLIACVVEYLTSWAMEKMFHERWWDYSKKLFNLNGRVCLEGFVCFGLFSVAAKCLIQPFFDKKLALIPYTVQIVLIVILVTIFVVDLIRSVHIATHLKKEMEEMVKVLEREQMRIHQKFADYEVELEHLKNIKTLRGLIDQINIELKNKHYRYGSRRILKAFPYLVKKRIQETHERIREKE